MKQFILCVGCQKGGTTWLYEQLLKSKKFNGGPLKEYHVFDALYINDWIKRGLRDSLLRILQQGETPIELLLNLNLFHTDLRIYYDYFNYLWKQNSDITTVGDFTPDYCGLNHLVFRKIRKNLEDRGFSVKVVFLMRDPFERFWSMVRMNKKIMNSDFAIDGIVEAWKTTNEDLVLPKFDDEEGLTRVPEELDYFTRYDLTIKNLEKAFDKDQIYYGFYEDLFTDESINNLSKFLNVETEIFDKNDHVNESPKLEKISMSTIKSVCDRYHEVYKFVDQRFDVREKWKSFDYVRL